MLPCDQLKWHGWALLQLKCWRLALGCFGECSPGSPFKKEVLCSILGFMSFGGQNEWFSTLIIQQRDTLSFLWQLGNTYLQIRLIHHVSYAEFGLILCLVSLDNSQTYSLS